MWTPGQVTQSTEGARGRQVQDHSHWEPTEYDCGLHLRGADCLGVKLFNFGFIICRLEFDFSLSPLVYSVVCILLLYLLNFSLRTLFKICILWG